MATKIMLNRNLWHFLTPKEIILASYGLMFLSLYKRNIEVDCSVCKLWHAECSKQIVWQELFEKRYPKYSIELNQTNRNLEKYQDWKSLYIQVFYQFSYPLYINTELVPNIDDPEASFEDREVVDYSQACISRWIFLLKHGRQKFSTSVVLSKGIRTAELPLAEVYFWFNLLNVVQPLYEQLNSPTACKIIDALTLAERGNLEELQSLILEVNKAYTQAKWNAKYFKVLEKSFKQLADGSLREIACTIPVIIKTLKLMWSSSKYYSKREKMEGILDRIAIALCDRVAGNFTTHDILYAKDYDEVIDQTESAGLTLTRWHEVYDESMNTWGPFDTDKLYMKVDFTAQRCSEIRSILSMIRHLKLEMIPRLEEQYKDDNGDSSHLDQIRESYSRAVEAFRKILLNDVANASIFQISVVAINVFDPKNLSVWQHAVEEFRKEANIALRLAYKYTNRNCK